MNERTRLLIHVGFHKTGTTWLQRRVFSDEKSGFTTPWGPNALTALTDLVLTDPLEFDARACLSKLKNGIVEAQRRGLVAVLSQEALSSKPEAGWYYSTVVAERLKAVFPEARILITIREQGSLILSLYKQYVTSGGRFGVTEFLGTGGEPAGWAPTCWPSFFKFDQFTQHYQGLFGVENVLVLPFELLLRDRDSFVRKLLDFGGARGNLSLDDSREREALHPACVVLARGLNRFILRNPLGPDQPLSVLVLQRSLGMLSKRLPKRLGKSISDRWEAIIAKRIDGVYGAGNRRLQESHHFEPALSEYGYQME